MADRQYELIYILPPDSTEQQAAELHEQVEAVVSRLHGQIEKTENWGRRKLAYEIGHFKEGVYVLEVTAVYLLYKEWVVVQVGYLLWLRSFCPHAC